MKNSGHSGNMLEAIAMATDPGAPLATGYVVGEFRIVEEIGRGGFGTVYSAEHPLIGKLAAIKVLSRRYSSDADFVDRFVREARSVNEIKHSNIVDIFSFGRLADGRFYYVMELLEGEPLDRVLARVGRFSLEQTIFLLRGVARALDAAHGKGIVHRDLKPENIFVTLGPDREPFPKLLDFGIAKLLGDAADGTKNGAPLGTPYYMSPEQCRASSVDHRTDVYSLGVVAFQLLTGVPPFDGDCSLDLMLLHVAGAPPKLSEICPDIPIALDVAVAAMLAKRPEARPDSAGEALLELARAAGISVAPDVPAHMIQLSASGPQSDQRVTETTPAVPSTPSHKSERRKDLTAEPTTLAAAQNGAAPSQSQSALPKRGRMLWVALGGIALAMGYLGPQRWGKTTSAEVAGSDSPEVNVKVRDSLDSELQSCGPGTKRCNGTCVSTDRPDWSCGAESCLPCRLANAMARCNLNKQCDVTTCFRGYEDCDGNPLNGCESDVRTDPDHCGGCGIRCPKLPHAARGCGDVCTIWRCEAGYSDCNRSARDGCEIGLLSDRSNCGACGVQCPAGQRCKEGICAR